jgi:moderate conductance mechanosensitive channel
MSTWVVTPCELSATVGAMALSNILDDLFVTAGQFVALAVLFGLLAYALSLALAMARRMLPPSTAATLPRVQHAARRVLLVLFLLATAGLLAFNASLILSGRDVLPATLELLSTTLPPDFWVRLGWGLLQVVALVVLARLAIMALQRAAPYVQRRVAALPYLRDKDGRLERFFRALLSLLRYGIWLYVAALSTALLGMLAAVTETMFLALRIYLIIAGGRMVVGTIGTVINTLDALSEVYIRSERLDELYNQLRGLLPLLSRMLEFIIYVQAASLAIAQIGQLAGWANFGNTLTALIGIFFLSRIAVAVLDLLVDTFFLVRGELSDAQWQKRQTFAPLLKSVARYGTIFGGALLALTVLGFDIGPILVGLGGVGLVLGLAAQPVTTDLISGLFILFENLFLVGDYIETGNARGVVESIDVRTTRIRDPDGQLHLIRNGQIGDIVNYSKGYVYAVVIISVTYETDLQHAFALIAETGRRVDEQYEDVLEATVVQGIEEFADGKIHIRTLTRVKPGRHQQMARELRGFVKQAFDQAGIEMEQEVSQLRVMLADRPLDTTMRS